MVRVTYRTATIERDFNVTRTCSLCRYTWDRPVTIKGYGSQDEGMFINATSMARNRATKEFEANLRREQANEDPDAVCQRCGGLSAGALGRYFGGDIRRGVMKQYRRGLASDVGLMFLLVGFLMPMAIHVFEAYLMQDGLRAFTRALWGDIRNHWFLAALSVLLAVAILAALISIVEGLKMYGRVVRAVKAATDLELQHIAGHIYKPNRNSFESGYTPRGHLWTESLRKFARGEPYGRSQSNTPPLSPP